MIACYNVTGQERKEFVRVISEILDQPMVYRGVPRFLYEVGGHTIDRGGTLAFATDSDDESRQRLVSALQERGYTINSGEPPPSAEAAPDDTDRLVVDMPLDGFTDKALENLRTCIHGNESLRISVCRWEIMTKASSEATEIS